MEWRSHLNVKRTIVSSFKANTHQVLNILMGNLVQLIFKGKVFKWVYIRSIVQLQIYSIIWYSASCFDPCLLLASHKRFLVSNDILHDQATTLNAVLAQCHTILLIALPLFFPICRTNTILENFCENFGAAHFYASLWLCLNSNPSVRLSGTCYLLAHINKSRSMEDQLYLLGTDLSLLVRSAESLV